jgi:molybdopterin synthase catalytic subunit
MTDSAEVKAESQPPEDKDIDGTSFFITVSSEDKPCLDKCYKFVSHPSCGAISTFVGTTRDSFNGKAVSRLSYEGYVPMAVKELDKLCREAKTKYNVHRIAVQHVLGDCPVGEVSVIIAASSPHRSDALQCVTFMIEELKAKVPIWKLEVYKGEEDSVWKENVEWHGGKITRVMYKET